MRSIQDISPSLIFVGSFISSHKLFASNNSARAEPFGFLVSPAHNWEDLQFKIPSNYHRIQFFNLKTCNCHLQSRNNIFTTLTGASIDHSRLLLADCFLPHKINLRYNYLLKKFRIHSTVIGETLSKIEKTPAASVLLG